MSNRLRAAFAIPGDLQARTGGYGYDRRLLAALPDAEIDVSYVALPDGFPNADEDTLARAARALTTVPGETLLLVDGLAFGVLPTVLLREIANPMVVVLHHPLGLETGLSPERRTALIASETRALAFARRCVVTSPATARLVAEKLDYPLARIAIAEPGTDRAAPARGSASPTLTLFAAGSIIPRKGYDVLIAALAEIEPVPWRLIIAGNATRSPETALALRQQIAALDLDDRVSLRGDLDEGELDALYARSDIFVMASHFEGYGMVLAEAMARGLPIVTTRAGATSETVPDGAALKAPPGDPAALASALRRMIEDAVLRESCAAASWEAGQALPRWRDTAQIVADLLRTVASERDAAP